MHGPKIVKLQNNNGKENIIKQQEGKEMIFKEAEFKEAT